MKTIGKSFNDNPIATLIIFSMLLHLFLLLVPVPKIKTHNKEQLITVELIREEPVSQTALTPAAPVKSSDPPSQAQSSPAKPPAPAKKTEPAKPPAPAKKTEPAKPAASAPKPGQLNKSNILAVAPQRRTADVNAQSFDSAGKPDPVISSERLQAESSSAQTSSTVALSPNQTSNPARLNDTINPSIGTNSGQADQPFSTASNQPITGKAGARSSVAGNSSSGLQIQGLEGRKILFIPEPPSMNIEDSNAVMFKVKILPFGTVSQVLPVQKGNPDLEKVAIQYLKQFKFEPISGSVIQEGYIQLKVIRGKLSRN